ncbi:MAG: thermonuclease family protein [Sediminibacterium sp.]|nr:thermonuclease family protein [Sediminibacterium sp.]
MKKLLILTLCFFAQLTFSQKTANVIRIVDGDTFMAVLSKSKDTVKIRVRYIDCPEGKNAICSREQVYHQEAEAEATKLLLNKTVKLYYANVQSFGREVARVKVGTLWYDRYMLYNGFAWANPQVKGLWLSLENIARKEQKGLFKQSLYAFPDEELMLPQDWRTKYSTRIK